MATTAQQATVIVRGEGGRPVTIQVSPQTAQSLVKQIREVEQQAAQNGSRPPPTR